jgi:hypothetical protein
VLHSFKAVVKFLENNELLSLIRAHEAQDAGYVQHSLTHCKSINPSVSPNDDMGQPVTKCIVEAQPPGSPQ